MRMEMLIRILNSLYPKRNGKDKDVSKRANLIADTAGELSSTRIVITNIGNACAFNVRFSSRNKTTFPYHKEDLPIPSIESGHMEEIAVVFEARRDAITLTWDDDHKEGNKRVQNIYFR